MAEHPAVEFLTAAWARAEKLARAARDAEFLTCGIWEPRGPYGENCDRGNIRSELREDIFDDAELRWEFVNHMALHDPASVLRRVAAERQILAEHQPTRDDWGGRLDEPCELAGCCCSSREEDGYVLACGSCATGNPYDAVLQHWPCRTVLLLAQAWGWTEEAG